MKVKCVFIGTEFITHSKYILKMIQNVHKWPKTITKNRKSQRGVTVLGRICVGANSFFMAPYWPVFSEEPSGVQVYILCVCVCVCVCTYNTFRNTTQQLEDNKRQKNNLHVY